MERELVKTFDITPDFKNGVWNITVPKSYFNNSDSMNSNFDSEISEEKFNTITENMKYYKHTVP